MEFTFYINKSLLWFAAGIAACILNRIIWCKFIGPGCVYISRKLHKKWEEKNNCEEDSVIEGTDTYQLDEEDEFPYYKRGNKSIKKMKKR